MDSFWSKLLILGIVAAIGIFFIQNVYTPQKEAQEAMAYSTQQSVNAVKAGVGGTVPLSYSSTDVVNEINTLCTATNTTNAVIVMKLDGTSHTFISSPTSGGQSISVIVDSSKRYLREASGTTITYREQP